MLALCKPPQKYECYTARDLPRAPWWRADLKDAKALLEELAN